MKTLREPPQNLDALDRIIFNLDYLIEESRNITVCTTTTVSEQAELLKTLTSKINSTLMADYREARNLMEKKG
jgi:hypothetical protein